MDTAACVLLCLCLSGLGGVQGVDPDTRTVVDTASRTVVETVRTRMAEVNSTNCKGASYNMSPYGEDQQFPLYHDSPQWVQERNRTSLQYAHNTAANRGLFFSMIYAWTNGSYQFESQPGLNYIYMSEAANVLAGPEGVTTSGLFYLPNRAYPNWMPTLDFNITLPLFAARASRDRGSNSATIKDLGATPATNYTDRRVYPQNDFIEDVVEKMTYIRYPHIPDYDSRYQVRYEMHQHRPNQTVSTFAFHATWASKDIRFQAKTHRAVYDCGQTNQWIVPIAAPVSEVLARYSPWIYPHSLKVVAMSTVGVLFDTIDINLCPASIGNPVGPFSGKAQCPSECKVLPGRGLSSDGFSCCDVPGCSGDRRFTNSEFLRGREEMNQKSTDPTTCQQNPMSTNPSVLSEEFWDLDDIKAVFEVQGRAGLRLAHFLSNFLQNNDPADNQRNEDYIQRMWDETFQRALEIRNEQQLRHPDRYAPFEVPEDIQVDSPARRLKVDQNLNRKWIEAEAFSTLMVDGQILSAGIYMEPGVFPNSSHPVSALAWRSSTPPDYAQLSTSRLLQGHVTDVFQMGENFTAEDFYTKARQEFAATNGNRREFRTKSTVRTGPRTAPIVEAVPGEVTYTSINFEDGQWLPPHFRCDVRMAQWVVSYMAPIFAKSPSGDGVVFGGVVKVDSYFTDSHIFTM